METKKELKEIISECQNLGLEEIEYYEKEIKNRIFVKKEEITYFNLLLTNMEEITNFISNYKTSMDSNLLNSIKDLIKKERINFETFRLNRKNNFLNLYISKLKELYNNFDKYEDNKLSNNNYISAEEKKEYMSIFRKLEILIDKVLTNYRSSKVIENLDLSKCEDEYREITTLFDNYKKKIEDITFNREKEEYLNEISSFLNFKNIKNEIIKNPKNKLELDYAKALLRSGKELNLARVIDKEYINNFDLNNCLLIEIYEKVINILKRKHTSKEIVDCIDNYLDNPVLAGRYFYELNIIEAHYLNEFILLAFEKGIIDPNNKIKSFYIATKGALELKLYEFLNKEKEYKTDEDLLNGIETSNNIHDLYMQNIEPNIRKYLLFNGVLKRKNKK